MSRCPDKIPPCPLSEDEITVQQLKTIEFTHDSVVELVVTENDGSTVLVDYEVFKRNGKPNIFKPRPKELKQNDTPRFIKFKSKLVDEAGSFVDYTILLVKN